MATHGCVSRYSESDSAPPWKVEGVIFHVSHAAAAVTRNAGSTESSLRFPKSHTYASRRNGNTKAGAFDRNASTAGIRYKPHFRCAGYAANHSRPATTPNVQYTSAR